jgi:hypothetical protein
MLYIEPSRCVLSARISRGVIASSSSLSTTALLRALLGCAPSNPHCHAPRLYLFRALADGRVIVGRRERRSPVTFTMLLVTFSCTTGAGHVPGSRWKSITKEHKKAISASHANFIIFQYLIPCWINTKKGWWNPMSLRIQPQNCTNWLQAYDRIKKTYSETRQTAGLGATMSGKTRRPTLSEAEQRPWKRGDVARQRRGGDARLLEESIMGFASERAAAG